MSRQLGHRPLPGLPRRAVAVAGLEQVVIQRLIDHHLADAQARGPDLRGPVTVRAVTRALELALQGDAAPDRIQMGDVPGIYAPAGMAQRVEEMTLAHAIDRVVHNEAHVVRPRCQRLGDLRNIVRRYEVIVIDETHVLASRGLQQSLTFSRVGSLQVVAVQHDLDVAVHLLAEAVQQPQQLLMPVRDRRHQDAPAEDRRAVPGLHSSGTVSLVVSDSYASPERGPLVKTSTTPSSSAFQA